VNLNLSQLRHLWPLLAVVACNNPNATPSPTSAETTTKPIVDAPPPGVDLPEVERDPREALLAQGFRTFLSEEHLRQRDIDDALSREAFDEYLEALDGGKLYLLSSHESQLRKMADRLDDQLAAGNLRIARMGAGLMKERRMAVAKMVATILAKPFDLDKDESVQTDPEKLTFSATDSELQDRWRKVLKLQALERIARMEKLAETLAKGGSGGAPGSGGTPGSGGSGGAGGAGGAGPSIEPPPATLEGKEAKAREEMRTSYEARFKRLLDIDALDPAQRFLNAFASVFDPHTLYLPPADKANFDISMSGSLEGIGAALGVKDHFIEVRELVPGGASWRQGKLEAGDLILAVAQHRKKPVDVTDMPIDKVVQKIRGKKGTVVTLTVKKPDGRVTDISITRDVVVIEAAYARGAVLDLGASSDPVGYINLPSFYGSTRRSPGAAVERSAAADVGKLLDVFQKSKLSGVILDLRGNGGGLLSHARDIVGHLIATGPVVQSRDAKGKMSVEADRDPRIAFSGEVIVMTDRFSASASEIVAGAIQDYGRGAIVGTGPTHGKGTVQILVDLDRLRPTDVGDPLGVLKLTIQQYFRVTGASTQSKGVIPDVTLPDPAGYVESGERFLDHPIPWSSVDPLRFERWPGTSWVSKGLADKSKSRVVSEAAFEKIAARNALLEKRQSDTLVPLQRKAWLVRRDAFTAELDGVDAKLSDGPARFSVKPINYSKSPPPQDKKLKKRLQQWQDDLAHDPWVQEALNVVDDMR
jgi:carboxyl-terminal processing protease